jgi:hypothetical protein
MKIDELVDKQDLKIKHISGEYLHYTTHSIDDIVYAILSKGRKSMKFNDIVKVFGEEKRDQLSSLVDDMVSLGYASVTGEEDKTISLL